MKFFLAMTYQRGNVIVRAKNKQEAIQFLNENKCNIYAIEPLSKFINTEIGTESNVIIEIKNIIS